MGGILSLVGAFAASALLGLSKKYTGALDGDLAKLVKKPLQPLVVAAAALALPAAAHALHIAAPDAQQFVNAPTATIAAIAAREAIEAARRAAS